MELRKTEVEKKRIERMQAKKSNFQKVKVGEKRLIDDNEVGESRNGRVSYGRIWVINK
jgi:hypothetical protein